MKLHNKIYKFQVLILILGVSALICSLCGCEAFVRKFTRKPKGEEPKPEMVLIPEEYPTLFANTEEAYRTYFLYWQSWQDELINALLNGMSQKKQLSCVDEAIKNLMQIKTLLLEEKQKELEAYIVKLTDLRSNIQDDPYSSNAVRNRSTAEILKRNILRDFSYSKVKGSVK
jgi:hypothetical protein